MFDVLFVELCVYEDVELFVVLVDVWYVLDYYVVIEWLIDVATMRARVGASVYVSKDVFVEDLVLMEVNVVVYNGVGLMVVKMVCVVVGVGEEMLWYVSRVDFETCERVAAYAARVERGEMFEGEGESESESESEEMCENDVDELGMKLWRKWMLETRVRRVFRAKAFADAFVGMRRVC